MRSAAIICGGYRPLITTASLKTQSWKDLADLAKTKGLSGWHSMRKDELVKALVRAAQRQSKLRAPSTPKTSGGHKIAKAKAVRQPASGKPHPSQARCQPRH